MQRNDEMCCKQSLITVIMTFLGSRAHGGGVPDRQVLVDAGGQGARRPAARPAREEHDRAAHRAAMKQKIYIYCTQRKSE